MAEAGFVEELYGTGPRPIVKYLFKDEASASDIEFLCRGSGLRGERSKSGTMSSHPMQPTLFAQPLRYLELLQYRTWEIDLGRVPESVAFRGVHIRVPNPAAYVIQKVLIRGQRRGAQSTAKDCYYIYEASVIFRDSFDALTQESAALKEEFPQLLKNFSKKAGKLFAGPDAEGPVSALRIFKEARASFGSATADLTAEMVWRSLERLLVALR